MADSIKLTVSTDGISRQLNSMLSRSGLVRGWLNRVGYPLVIEAQRLRWASEGASEGESWEPLNPRYATRKLKKWKAAPGGGRKMLIASGKLVDSVTGDNTADHYKLVENTKMEVGSLVLYAKWVNEKRNFVRLGPNTIKTLSDKLNQYLRGIDE